MDRALVTIILPVYNIENYVDRCVESAVKQTYENIEILLIDDGSQDASGLKCDQWAEKDARITVYHKPNGGLSDARNYGMERTHGQYILFLDGDDLLEPFAVSCLLPDALTHNAEIVVGNERFIQPIKRDKRLSDILTCHTVYSGKDYLYNSLIHDVYKVTVWRMLYQTEFLTKTRLNFKYGIYFEDDVFTPQAFLLAERVVLVKDQFIIYDNTRPDSIDRSMQDGKKKAADRIEIMEYMAKVYQSVTPIKLRNELLNTLSWKFLAAYRRFGQVDHSLFMKYRLAPLKYARRFRHICQSLVFVISPALYLRFSKKHYV